LEDFFEGSFKGFLGGVRVEGVRLCGVGFRCNI